MELLPDRLSWFIAGPGLGLLVVAFYALGNKHLGVTRGYLAVVTWLRQPRSAEMWRVWFIGGLIAGALLAAFLQGGPSTGLAYGAAGVFMPLAALIPLLFLAGVLMGYGALWAGGCTSGHGLTGTSARSPAAIIATISFMATAIAVTFVIYGLTGGGL